MNNIYRDLLLSCNVKKGVSSTEDLLAWIKERNESQTAIATIIPLSECSSWNYDSRDGSIHNDTHSFFSIVGLKKYDKDELVFEQPIIVQDEIGFLGILAKRIDGVMHVLMQAKIEPGNINVVQISPTIQATKSNFTQRHYGRKPAFLEYFLSAASNAIVFDQIQSEQSSRFLKKRNRNIMVLLDDNDPIEIPSNFKWMTLGQLKELMTYENLVNMDTRTVISCIPFIFGSIASRDSLFSLENVRPSVLADAFRLMNNRKMFNEGYSQVCDLYSLQRWEMREDGFVCKDPFPFKVIFCSIEIEGREVRSWCQPLLKAEGRALFGLLISRGGKGLEILVRLADEVGCFDIVEIGPTIQFESIVSKELDPIEALFAEMLDKSIGVVFDNILSEEGGRFYHEENRNVVLEIDRQKVGELPKGYFWCDFSSLNLLVQFNNVLNIQLRNLLAVLEVW